MSVKIDRHSIKLRQLFLKDKDDEEKGKGPVNKYRYLQMTLPWEKVPELMNSFHEKNENNSFSKDIKIEPVTQENLEDFVRIFNRILLTSPDPYREMRCEEAEVFSEGTFLASLWWQPAGFLVLVIEENIKGKVGVIAGLGVDHRHRRKGIGMALGLKAAEYFAEKKVSSLVCEVYEKNLTSQKFIKAFGFEESGEIYI